ncbi:hypothetical protein NQZ68_033987 [Dissostichus eleginoides]|nr:hypothetical protein NQZ68_033987 [Dissostichus eleginoides]
MPSLAMLERSNMAAKAVNKPPSAHPSRVHGNTRANSGGPSSDQHDPGLYTPCTETTEPHPTPPPPLPTPQPPTSNTTSLAGLSSTSMLHPHPLSTPTSGPCPSPITLCWLPRNG